MTLPTIQMPKCALCGGHHSPAFKCINVISHADNTLKFPADPPKDSPADLIKRIEALEAWRKSLEGGK